MPVSSITQVILRLFALHWFLAGIIPLASLMLFVGDLNGYFSFIPPITQVVVGVGFWFLAPAISRLVARKNDPKISLEGVTEEQLFATAFISLGLYFSLKSFSSVFNWLHFFVVKESPDYGFHQELEPSYYDFTEQGLTLAAGLYLILSAKGWAAKLSRSRKSEQGTDADA
tara:strand:- start:609 stop:1121 length:513 start_codon:yes stop_codon:yes gene_type:complete